VRPEALERYKEYDRAVWPELLARTERICAWNPNQNYTRAGDTLFVHQDYWPKIASPVKVPYLELTSVIAIAGLKGKAKSARLPKTGQSISFIQEGSSLRLTNLPRNATFSHHGH
jgi:hypothetical protein